MPTREEVDQKMERRARETNRSYRHKVIEKLACYKTGGGVVLVESLIGQPTVTAHFFKPRQLKRGFAEHPITSAHERISVLDTLHELIANEKAQKVAPHNLKVGDIIAQIWGSTMQGVFFHVVSDIPSPRKVTLVPAQARVESGDHMSGTKVPAIEPGTVPDKEGVTYMVEMRRDQAYVKMGEYDRASLWDGKPIMVYSD